MDTYGQRPLTAAASPRLLPCRGSTRPPGPRHEDGNDELTVRHEATALVAALDEWL
jgi:hypothetical protein